MDKIARGARIASSHLKNMHNTYDTQKKISIWTYPALSIPIMVPIFKIMSSSVRWRFNGFNRRDSKSQLSCYTLFVHFLYFVFLFDLRLDFMNVSKDLLIVKYTDYKFRTTRNSKLVNCFEILSILLNFLQTNCFYLPG